MESMWFQERWSWPRVLAPTFADCLTPVWLSFVSKFLAFLAEFLHSFLSHSRQASVSPWVMEGQGRSHVERGWCLSCMWSNGSACLPSPDVACLALSQPPITLFVYFPRSTGFSFLRSLLWCGGVASSTYWGKAETAPSLLDLGQWPVLSGTWFSHLSNGDNYSSNP